MSVYKDGPQTLKVRRSAKPATHVGGSRNSEGFRMRVRWMRQAAKTGRDCDVRAFGQIFEARSSAEGTSLKSIAKVKGSPEEGP